MEQKVSPRKRGSRPTITRAPFGFCEVTCRAIPCTARRTFSKVNSSAITARHPDVPNLICVVMGCFVQLIFFRWEGTAFSRAINRFFCQTARLKPCPPDLAHDRAARKKLILYD